MILQKLLTKGNGTASRQVLSLSLRTSSQFNAPTPAALLSTSKPKMRSLVPFPPVRRFSSSSIFDNNEESSFVDIGEAPSYKGSLVIVPTPIGNLGDLSVRQMEALTQCDIIACEDTRKTGKMLELIFQKRMKDRFKAEFGASFDTFMDGQEEEELKYSAHSAAEEKADTASETEAGVTAADTPEENQALHDENEEAHQGQQQFFSTDRDEMLLHRL